MEEMRTKLIEYGYDRELAEEWFTTSGAEWDTLKMEQDKASMELGQK